MENKANKKEREIHSYHFFLYLIILCLLAYCMIFLTRAIKNTKEIDNINTWKNIENVISKNNSDLNSSNKNETTKKNTFVTDDWLTVEMKENMVDSIDELDFSYDESEKTWLWIIAVDEEWYFQTNYNDFDFDSDWNLPSVLDRLTTWPVRTDWFEQYTLDLNKKIDKKLYQSMQWFHESALKRTWVEEWLIDMFKYATYKKWNFYKITVEVDEELKEELFYLWKIELNYLTFWDYFWWVIDNEELLDRWIDNIHTLWEQDVEVENINYNDDEDTKLFKFKTFIYSFVYNSSDLQKWNTIRIDLHKENTINWENWIELECYTGELEDYDYWYKLHLWNLCTIFQNKQFMWYTNEIWF